MFFSLFRRASAKAKKTRRFHLRFRFIVEEEYQPLSVVPLLLWASLAASLAAQIVFAVYLSPPPQARAEQLPPPPSPAALRVVAFGDEPTLGKLLMLRLQTFDNQPGISIPFRDLDYQKLTGWLDGIVALDPRAAYPHLHGARVYTDVPDDARRRIMIDWVRRQFLERPQTRWEWLAHCVTLARHKLDDLPYALELARLLRENTAPGDAPSWARQMEIFLREDMDEYDSAAALLSGLLAAGEVKDPHEFNFLYIRLKGLLDKALGGDGDQNITVEELLKKNRQAIQSNPALQNKIKLLIDLEGQYLQALEEIAQ
jgi:hypothetical protein